MPEKNTSTLVARNQAIPAETIEAIRALCPIEEVISEHVRLRRSGAQLLGRCPFHDDKTPSFSVHPVKQVFYCHGCHAGGDVFSFVARHYRLSFPEAVRWVGRKVGISPDAPLPEGVRPRILEFESKQQKEEWKLVLATKAEDFLREYLFGSMRHTAVKDQIADCAWLVLAEYHRAQAARNGELEAFEEFKEARIDAA